MSTDVITINVNGSMIDALKLLKQHNIRMLPVMEKGKLVGILSDLDVKRVSVSDTVPLDIHKLFYVISKIKVGKMMNKVPFSVPPDYTVEEAAEILLRNEISGVHVIDHQGKIVGVNTETDIFKVLISLTGLRKRGIQFGLQVEDRPGSIKEVTDTVRRYGGRIISILSSDERAPKGYQKVYIRTHGIERGKLPRLREELKEKTYMSYMVDHRENIRELYERSDS